VSQTEALDGGPNGAWDTSDAAHIPFKPVMLNSQVRGAARAPGCCEGLITCLTHAGGAPLVSAPKVLLSPARRAVQGRPYQRSCMTVTRGSRLRNASLPPSEPCTLGACARAAPRSSAPAPRSHAGGARQDVTRFRLADGSRRAFSSAVHIRTVGAPCSATARKAAVARLRSRSGSSCGRCCGPAVPRFTLGAAGMRAAPVVQLQQHAGAVARALAPAAAASMQGFQACSGPHHAAAIAEHQGMLQAASAERVQAAWYLWRGRRRLHLCVLLSDNPSPHPRRCAGRAVVVTH